MVRGWIPLPREPGNSLSARSTTSASTPRRARSMPRVNPLGPAPTTSTSTGAAICRCSLTPLSSVSHDYALNVVKLSNVTTERRVPLDRKQIAGTARNLLIESALERLTLSAIGYELGVKAPALYCHFKNKQ